MDTISCQRINLYVYPCKPAPAQAHLCGLSEEEASWSLIVCFRVISLEKEEVRNMFSFPETSLDNGTIHWVAAKKHSSAAPCFELGLFLFFSSILSIFFWKDHHSDFKAHHLHISPEFTREPLEGLPRASYKKKKEKEEEGEEKKKQKEKKKERNCFIVPFP